MLVRYISALRAAAPMRITRVPPTSTRLRSSWRSSKGAGARLSTRTNAKIDAMETAKQSRVQPDSQPHDEPSLMARMSGTRMSAMSAVPSQSIERERSGSLDSATDFNVIGIHSAAITRSIQNSPCQPLTSTRKPPTSGPAAAPMADAAPHRATALSLAGPLEATVSRLMPQARMVAPAAPWMTRPAITWPPVWASPMSAQETTNRPSPPRKILRRPNTSPRAPDVTMTAAPMSE